MLKPPPYLLVKTLNNDFSAPASSSSSSSSRTSVSILTLIIIIIMQLLRTATLSFSFRTLNNDFSAPSASSCRYLNWDQSKLTLFRHFFTCFVTFSRFRNKCFPLSNLYLCSRFIGMIAKCIWQTHNSQITFQGMSTFIGQT